MYLFLFSSVFNAAHLPFTAALQRNLVFVRFVQVRARVGWFASCLRWSEQDGCLWPSNVCTTDTISAETCHLAYIRT
ncbi:hypothetical protein K7X08_032359 [Anisodus acutangulus]|uniref:Secreted protein n=1 Tax=Anisodus acutangulus TaxID=402998 RepID=A0A9Q1M489_9SOLA|nr:hypothetical protein K7X08_032359 [Anisodus acutangulus]